MTTRKTPHAMPKVVPEGDPAFRPNEQRRTLIYPTALVHERAKQAALDDGIGSFSLYAVKLIRRDLISRRLLDEGEGMPENSARPSNRISCAAASDPNKQRGVCIYPTTIVHERAKQAAKMTSCGSFSLYVVMLLRDDLVAKGLLERHEGLPA